MEMNEDCVVIANRIPIKTEIAREKKAFRKNTEMSRTFLSRQNATTEIGRVFRFGKWANSGLRRLCCNKMLRRFACDSVCGN